MDVKKVQDRIEELEWLRTAVMNMPTQKDVTIRVNLLTKLGGEIAKEKRRLFELENPDVNQLVT